MVDESAVVHALADDMEVEEESAELSYTSGGDDDWAAVQSALCALGLQNFLPAHARTGWNIRAWCAVVVECGGRTRLRARLGLVRGGGGGAATGDGAWRS